MWRLILFPALTVLSTAALLQAEETAPRQQPATGTSSPRPTVESVESVWNPRFRVTIDAETPSLTDPALKDLLPAGSANSAFSLPANRNGLVCQIECDEFSLQNKSGENGEVEYSLTATGKARLINQGTIIAGEDLALQNEILTLKNVVMTSALGVVKAGEIQIAINVREISVGNLDRASRSTPSASSTIPAIPSDPYKSIPSTTR